MKAANIYSHSLIGWKSPKPTVVRDVKEKYRAIKVEFNKSSV
jgi:hypothetical protein